MTETASTPVSVMIGVLRWCNMTMQAAFKRAPPSSAADLSLQSASASPVQDWESIKPEDKTLVHQVTP